MVPPGQILPTDVIRALIRTVDDERQSRRTISPTLTVRLHPADRAWLPPGFEGTAGRIVTEHADTCGVILLDGIRVTFTTDSACDLGAISIHRDQPATLDLIDNPATTSR